MQHGPNQSHSILQNNKGPSGKFPSSLPWGCSITHPHICCRFLQCGDQWAGQRTHTDNKGAGPVLAAQYSDLGRSPPFPLFHSSSSSLTHISIPHTGLVDAPKSRRRITVPVPPSLSVYCTPNTFFAFFTPSLSAMLETSRLLVLDVYYVTYLPTLILFLFITLISGLLYTSYFCSQYTNLECLLRKLISAGHCP